MPEGRKVYRLSAGGINLLLLRWKLPIARVTECSLTTRVSEICKTNCVARTREEVAVEKIIRFFLLVVLVTIGGCASFSIEPLSADKPEQVWQAKAIRFDRQVIEETGQFSAVIVRAPEEWVRSERSGTLPVGSNGRIAIVRNAWRAIAFFLKEDELETSAILGPENALVVLLPGVSESRARSAKILILSGLSAFALDASGREYGGDVGFDMERFIEVVRKGSVSIPLPEIVENLNPGTANGDLFLKRISVMFPEEKRIDGVIYRVVATAPEGLARATHGYLSVDDRFVSNAELFVTPGMGLVSLGEAALRSTYNIGTARPQGPYRLPKIQTVTTPEREKAGDQ